MPHLEINEVDLIHFNIVNNNYQQHLGGLYTFVPKKSFDQSLEISPTSFIFLKTLDPEFSYHVLRFTDQSFKPLKVKDKMNIILVIS